MIKHLLALSFSLFSFCALALPPETQLKIKQGIFSHFTSHDLLVKNPNIERVIITIHGSERNAHTYYNSIEAMTKKMGLTDKTIVIAPHFKEAQDQLLGYEFYWTPEGWLSGDPDYRNRGVSSFEVMDHMIGLLADKNKFPNLKRVTITGHSAGGQLAQRYAAGSSIDSKYPHLKFRYIVANPGSYVYLTRNRPVKPAVKCAYHDYKYGLDNLNPYMEQSSVKSIQTRYVAKQVVYFLGEQDIRSDDIDQACPARYQGNTRLERGRFFKAQLDKEFPQSKHYIFSVPGVGHTQYGMYTSALGQKVLFEEL